MQTHLSHSENTRWKTAPRLFSLLTVKLLQWDRTSLENSIVIGYLILHRGQRPNLPRSHQIKTPESIGYAQRVRPRLGTQRAKEGGKSRLTQSQAPGGGIRPGLRCERPFIRPTPSLMGEDIVCAEQFQLPFFSLKGNVCTSKGLFEEQPCPPGSPRSSVAPAGCPLLQSPQAGRRRTNTHVEKHLRLLIPAFTGPFSHTV